MEKKEKVAKKVPKKAVYKRKPNGKKATGRPSSYDEKYCKQVIAFMKKGNSLADFAGKIGVAEDTIYEWRREHKDFSESVKVGAAMSKFYWSRIMHAASLGRWPKDTPVNVPLLMLQVKNRGGYSDVGVSVTVENHVNTEKAPEELTQAEIKAKGERLLLAGQALLRKGRYAKPENAIRNTA